MRVRVPAQGGLSPGQAVDVGEDERGDLGRRKTGSRAGAVGSLRIGDVEGTAPARFVIGGEGVLYLRGRRECRRDSAAVAPRPLVCGDQQVTSRSSWKWGCHPE